MKSPLDLAIGLVAICLVGLMTQTAGSQSGQQSGAKSRPSMVIKPTVDFEVTGTGDHASWRDIEWTSLSRHEPDGHPYDSRVKVRYSSTGLYFLMDATDRILTATMNEDFMDLWNEDVFEVFLWTDERFPVYFEYESHRSIANCRFSSPISEGSFLVGARGITRKAALHARPQVSSEDPSNRMRQFRGGVRSSSFRTRCCDPCRTSRPRPAHAGARTFIGWTMTPGDGRGGRGRTSTRASTNTKNSAICSSPIADPSGVRWQAPTTA